MKDVRDREEAELLSGIAVPDVAQKCTCCSSGCNIAGEFEQLKEEAAVERRELQERVSELQALNARLQKALTSKIFASVVARDRTVDLPFTAATSSAATTESSRAMPEEEERHGTVDTQRPFVSHDGIDLVIGTARDDRKVYIGCGLWVSKEAWGTLFRATSDSMFCRLASTMFWTPDELNNRSVTGTLSNKSRSKGRTEARPALTPQKLSSLKGVLS
ncbi:hypothetical protein HPB49_009368 [Dermacentor silvarum]|uniref:Uncharacterized protein n=1 Tax=Dermacentor silvarum TaxID=543639 RepID=A0ACB8DYS4_DERSI|nr:hypothetical protein HPB49_009368 [Dermacentor silvarum]